MHEYANANLGTHTRLNKHMHATGNTHTHTHTWRASSARSAPLKPGVASASAATSTQGASGQRPSSACSVDTWQHARDEGEGFQ